MALRLPDVAQPIQLEPETERHCTYRRWRLHEIDRLLWMVEEHNDHGIERASGRCNRVVPANLLRLCHRAGVDERARSGSAVHEALLRLQEPYLRRPINDEPDVEWSRTLVGIGYAESH
jgi:hypothetical protein